MFDVLELGGFHEITDGEDGVKDPTKPALPVVTPEKIEKRCLVLSPHEVPTGPGKGERGSGLLALAHEPGA
jgi:hypothetical protein